MIYNRQTIALLMRLCKLVSGEFGVRLHLDDPDIVSKIKNIVSAGASQETLSVWRSVREQIAPEGAAVVEAQPHLVYRGQASDEPPGQPCVVPPLESRPKSVRIYRGCVVN